MNDVVWCLTWPSAGPNTATTTRGHRLTPTAALTPRFCAPCSELPAVVISEVLTALKVWFGFAAVRCLCVVVYASEERFASMFRAMSARPRGSHPECNRRLRVVFVECAAVFVVTVFVLCRQVAAAMFAFHLRASFFCC
jgi:hypothetical protein